MPQGRIKTCIKSYLRKILTEKAALCEAREGATGGMARSHTWERPFPRVASAFATRGKTHSITTLTLQRIATKSHKNKKK